MIPQIDQTKKVHYNVPQLLFYAVLARISVVFAGRATGKTEGPLALFTLHNNISMPRSLNGICTTTYEKMLTTVLPKLVLGWEKLGYYEDIHFVIRKAPPKHFKKAYKMPSKFDHYVGWFNGSGNPLLSLDRPALANGYDLDSLGNDECRFFKENRIKDVLLTLRGNAEHFGKMSCHKSVLFCTDLPQDATGRWLFEYEKEMNREVVELALKVQATISKLYETYMSCTDEKKKNKIGKEIDEFQNYLNELRKDLVYVGYASTLDNVHALGLDTIKQFKRQLTDFEFAVSVLNRRIESIENGFYGLLDDEKHGYDAGNFEYMDGLQLDFKSTVEKNCLWDSDLSAAYPLQIALDYNAAINTMTIGQEKETDFEVQNYLYVLGKENMRLGDLLDKFDRYYAPHKHLNNTVIYYYDHTATGTNAASDIRFCDIVIDGLRSKGWNVIDKYIGQAPSHHSQYLLWSKMLKGDPDLPNFRYNRTNCADLKIAMSNTPVKQTEKGFKKDKSSERDPNVPPEHATHGTEAAGTLIYGSQRPKLSSKPEFIELLY